MRSPGPSAYRMVATRGYATTTSRWRVCVAAHALGPATRMMGGITELGVRMTIWLLIILEWVMLVAGVLAAEYALRRRLQR